MLAAQLTVVWLALHAHAEPKYGTAKSICSHCNSTGHADTCDAYAQTHRLNAHLSKLRHFVKGEGPFASLCTGPTQQSCSVKHPYGRKSCARRVCAPEQLLGRFTPPDAAAAAGGAAATAELATVRANLTTGFEPKLTIGRYAFLGSDFLDFFLYNLFFRGATGPGHVFVEAGALNGIDESNTWWFEHYAGWSGLLVEPTSCAPCQLPVNRPGAARFHGAICPAGTPQGKTFDARSMDAIFCGRSNTGSAPSEAEQRCSKSLSQIGGLRVPCSPLSAIFAAAGLRRIDLLSLDVEGFSTLALQSIDWAAVDISVAVVECRRDEDIDLLRANGYATLALTHREDGMRGFLADVLAWKPAQWRSLCSSSPQAGTI